jgi:hypothetical protein
LPPFIYNERERKT